ncbi:hypothetical protein EYC80_004178 [Monilinia laxa]|uniref:peptide-methionine (S)-S-oxide reductase n=1 Tax=Monilinia laxa TaxID=61186 RepID=A0A5N6KLX7_MONLA|nr:hypothetical protein EYC80_004178 [Monilinia laxa]
MIRSYNLPSQPISFKLFLLILLATMAGMPNFLNCLIRPFTSSSFLSITPASASSVSIPETAQKFTIAAGCFWGVESMYRKEFDGKGVYDWRVGYTGGDTANPDYKTVYSGRTAHAEALQIHYDPARISYRQLITYFYRMHDPTTLNSQGPDIGTHYRSAIFYHNEEQEKEAREITKQVNEKWWKGAVVTEILKAGQWWDAEAYHQKYSDNNPGSYECPSHFVRKFPDLDN